MLAKIAAGALSIGAGLSLGREGPSIQIGASAGIGISRWLGLDEEQEIYFLTAGASAGLAAAFNAPLAGAIFALEELHKKITPEILVVIVGSSFSGMLVTRWTFGSTPLFHFAAFQPLSLNNYFVLIRLGIVCGLMGVLFNSSLIRSLDLFARIHGKLNQYKIIIPVLFAIIIGFSLPEILGGGESLVNSLGKNEYTLSFLVLLLITKFLFTMLSYGSGASGGIFLPLLAIGALAGSVYAQLVFPIAHISSGYLSDFILFAMAGIFASIVKAPVTGSLLLIEMTGAFSQLYNVAIVSMLSYLVAYMLGSYPIYEQLLNRKMGYKAVRRDSPVIIWSGVKAEWGGLKVERK